MALINLTTDLKSLKFGNDRPGGGSSNQPYITKSIPDQDSSPSNVFNTGGPDVLLRGGLIAPIRAGLDVGRLAQMFFDFKSAAGPLFIAKQNLLSRTSVKTENSVGIGYAGGPPSQNFPLEVDYFAQTQINQGIYSPTSTLAQAAVGFTGTHLNTFGLNPASPLAGVINSGGLQGGLVGYNDVIKQRNSSGEDIEDKNRLVWIWNNKQAKTPISTVGIAGDRVTILEYSGGPGSILGIGSTKLKFADQRTGYKNPGISVNGLGYLAQGPVYGKYEDLKNEVNPIQSGSVYPLGISNIFNTISSAGEVPTELSTDNGLTFNLLDNEGNAINSNIYNSGSLSPREDIKTYQVQKGLRQNPRQNFVNPLGVSKIFKQYIDEEKVELSGNEDFAPKIDDWRDLEITPSYPAFSTDLESDNGFSFNVVDRKPLSVYESGSLIPDLRNEIKKSNFINYNTTFLSGASKLYAEYVDGVSTFRNVTEEFNGITGEGQRLFSDSIYTSPLSPISESKSYLASWGKGGINSATSPYSNTIDYRQFLGLSNTFANITNISQSLFNEVSNNINESDGQKSNTYDYNVYEIIPNSTGSSTNFIPTPLSYVNNTYVFSQNDIYDASQNGEGNALNSKFRNTNPQDFRKKVIDNSTFDVPNNPGAKKVLSLSPDYKTRGRRSRVSAGDPGAKNRKDGTKNVFNYGEDATKLEALDKINAQPIYTGRGPRGDLAINDFAKFRIAVLNNDSNNGSAEYIHFRAFVDQFGDSYQANWTPITYVGRGDNFYNYGGFNRSISMAFTVFAQSKAELGPMYRKLNYLASSLAPDYTGAGLMRGTMVRLTFGAYLYEVPGFITSLQYEIPQESPWEISIDEKGAGDGSVKELSHMIKVTGLSFTPVHNFLVQKPNNAYSPTNERYISLSTGFRSKGLYGQLIQNSNGKKVPKYYNASPNAIIPGEGEGEAF